MRGEEMLFDNLFKMNKAEDIADIHRAAALRYINEKKAEYLKGLAVSHDNHRDSNVKYSLRGDIGIPERAATFSEELLRIIDAKQLTDVAVYKAAHIDRRLFSKIRSDVTYKPSRDTSIKLVLALNLTLSEAEDILKRNGMILSPSSDKDLIIQYCIENQIYKISEVNALLVELGAQPLER